MKKFRPAAVPIATIDPYFNMWSFADCLYDDDTRHWTGARNSMVGMIKNGKKYGGLWERFQMENIITMSRM